MKPATHSPLYVVFYPELAEIARQHGYAMAVHGSVARDCDLICVPWTDDAADPETIVAAMVEGFGSLKVLGPVGEREHGRRIWTIAFGHGVFDLSFTPRLAASASQPDALAGSVVGDEKAVTRIQNILAMHLRVDVDGEIVGTGPASYAIARVLAAHPAPANAEPTQENDK